MKLYYLLRPYFLIYNNVTKNVIDGNVRYATVAPKDRF